MVPNSVYMTLSQVDRHAFTKDGLLLVKQVGHTGLAFVEGLNSCRATLAPGVKAIAGNKILAGLAV